MLPDEPEVEPEFIESGEPASEPEPDEIPNAADRKSIRRFRDKAKREEFEAAEFWRGVLASDVGLREVWRLLALRCHAFADQFPCSPTGFPDANARDFDRGQQSLGLGLYQDLMVIDGEAMLKMHRLYDPRFQKPKRS